MIDLTTLHPMIVHFPIALLIVGFVSDIAGVVSRREFFSRAGFYLLIAGTLGVIAAYFSGDMAGEGLAEGGALKQALETHEAAAVAFPLDHERHRPGPHRPGGDAEVFGSAPLDTARDVSRGGALTIVRTGHYGGQLVYKHAAGVQLTIDAMPRPARNSD